MRTLIAALVAMLMLGSFAEAATPRTGVRHRPRHSSRVWAGATESAPSPAKKKKKTTVRRKKPAAKARTGSATTATKRPPSTKPR